MSSLVAAAGIALSLPAESQDIQEECEHVISPLPQNPFDPIPPNPYCDEEDLPAWDEELDSARHDPNENFPRWQRSAGTTYHRLEIPNAVRLDMLDLNIEFSTFSIGTDDDERLWRGNDLRGYVRLFDEEDITFREGESNFDLPRLLEAARRDVPVIAQEMPGVLRDFWDDVRDAVRPSRNDIIADFAGFFRRILPQYTRDGVITPEEAREITRLVKDHFEEVYHRELSQEEQRDLDSAIGRFRERTNELLGRLDIDNLIQVILADRDNNVFIGEHTFGEYRLLFEDMLPLLHVEHGENSIHAWADAYARLRARSDSMSMYHFDTSHGEYILRHGTLNETELLAEGHLRLDAEFHAGRPLRDFAGDASEEVLNAIDQIELLLGYQPVMIDATLDAQAQASVSLENSIQEAYEATVIDDEYRIGFGISHGFVYRFDLDFIVEARAWANSLEYEIGSDMRADIALREEEGQQVQVWRFIEDREEEGFFGASLGARWENLTVRDYSLQMRFSMRSGFERNMSTTRGMVQQEHLRLEQRLRPMVPGVVRDYILRTDFSMRPDFEGNVSTDIETVQQEHLRMEQRLAPIFAGVAGVHLGHFTLFATLQDTTIGTGMFVTSDRGTIEAHIDTDGHVRFAHLAALDGSVDDVEARALHRDRLLHEYSLFPARYASIWDLENQYRTSALHGLFLESGIDASFLGDPHEAPLVARLGIMIADDGYVRLGGFSGVDMSVYGAYAGAGSRAFGADVGLVQERVAERDSLATSIVVRSRLDINQFRLHMTAAGTMVSPGVARYLQYGENKFGYTYQILLETVLW